MVMIEVGAALLTGFAAGRRAGSGLPVRRKHGRVGRQTLAGPHVQRSRLNNITIPVDDGTTQIDHILLSRYGVFVIERILIYQIFGEVQFFCSY